MREKLTFLLFLSIITIGCSYTQDCDDNINKLPMYGDLKKRKEQLLADRIFLSECDKSPGRKEAATHLVMRGWQYFNEKKLDTSMMRFNQAWLLDSLNSEVYWGFGNLLGLQKKFNESIPLFKKSLKLNSKNSKVWLDMSTSYGNIFFQSKDIKYLNSSIEALKEAINLDDKNPHLYARLTAAYCYFTQKDSANKYLKLTDQLDSSAINQNVKKFLLNR